MKKKKILMIFSLILLTICLMIKNLNIGAVFAQGQGQPAVEQVTANVRVGGSLGAINVECYPVNFTIGATGLNPATAENPKIRACSGRPESDIAVWLDPANNNVQWHIYINATNMTDGLGHFIPVDNIKINTTCDVGTGFSTLSSLDEELQWACTDIPYNKIANISFYLDVPAGQYNNTYTGNIWLYINGTGVETQPKNRTWGPGDTEVYIEKFIDIAWGSPTIDFETVAAGRSANATDSENGWPNNITSTPVTNIFIDAYINGTDFINTTTAVPENPDYCSAGNCSFESENVTYSNTTDLASWPDNILDLSNDFYSYSQIFDNWKGTNFGNDTAKNVWWNITIPGGMPAADYYAYIWAKASKDGEAP